MGRLLATLGLLCPSLAWAAGVSSDVELVRPAFSEGGTPGLDSPLVSPVRAIRVGTLVQVEHQPVVFYRGGEYDADVVRWRAIAHLGMSAAIAKQVALRIGFPFALQTGGTVPDLLSNGLAAGDIEAGVRVQALASGPWALGARADLAFPIGSRGAWMGETTVRPSGALLGMARWSRFALLADLGFTWRPPEDTGLDYVMGSTVNLGAGVRMDVVPERLSLAWTFLSRSGTTNFWGGGAETASELLGGIQAWPSRAVQLDVGGGLGLSGGVGAATWRALGGVTWQPRPPPVQPTVPLSRLRVEAIPEDPVQAILTPTEVEVRIWEEGQLARVEETQITIRDPLQFEFATDHILPVSKPTLEAIADLLRTNSQIAYIVIEGHASEEGSFAYNYDLSDRRARAVFQALIENGVHPDRLSYRGMGEVAPVQMGAAEEELAVNRRVVFRIVRVYQAGETVPTYPSDVLIPWNGEPGKITQPPPPPPAPPPAPPVHAPDDPADPGYFQEEDEP